MEKRVAIVGVGQTSYVEAKKDQRLEEVIFEAATNALKEAGIDRNDIDSVVLGAYDLVDGRSILSMITAMPAGGYLKEEIKVCEDGIFAAVLGCMQILSGRSKITLVSSWSKCSEINLDIITNLNFDPFYERPLYLNETIILSLQACRYMTKYNITEEQAAKVTIKNLRNASQNEYAHRRKSDLQIEDVINSKAISWPLKIYDLPPRSDGACAIVLSSEERAEKIPGVKAWVQGVGWCCGGYYHGDRDLSVIESLEYSAIKAYKAAGIDKPLEQVDLAEVHDVSSFHELMEYEALKFCGPGEGGRFIDEGSPFINGRLPVNPSGGILSSNPYTAAGLVRLGEAALQIMGRAKGHQIRNVNIALAHGMTGMRDQGNCVFILSKE